MSPPRLRRSHRCSLAALAVVTATAILPHAQAADPAPPELPYTVRTRSYLGYSAPLRGDLRYIGMAGATIGLADTPIGAAENPAGPAMTVRNLDVIITENLINNETLQGGASTLLHSTQFGATGPAYPWGVSLSIRSPHGEGGRYSLADDSRINPELTVREMQLSASRLLFGDRLSLGVGLVLGSSQLTLAPESANSQAEDLLSSSGTTAFGFRFGLLLQLPDRWFIGLSGATPMRFAADSSANATSAEFGLTNFHQDVLLPWRGGIGVGWIPNRYLRAGASLRYAGTTENTALLFDNATRTGTTWTLQPSIGGNYMFYDRPGLNAEVSIGSYLEASGIEGIPFKPHLTFALLASPGIFFFGAGIDAAPGYSNASVAFGIDLLRTLAWQKIVPPNPPPRRYGGFLPRPLERVDDGLPRPIAPNWKPVAGLDYLDVGLKAPERLEKRLIETGRNLLLDPGQSLLDLGTGLRDSVGGLLELDLDVVPEPKAKPSSPSNVKKKKGTGPR